jgi:hypothetical protein
VRKTETLNEALQRARMASKLHELLDEFFIEHTTRSVEAIKRCKSEDLLNERAYLYALDQLEQNLVAYINKYNLIEARRQHVGNY